LRRGKFRVAMVESGQSGHFGHSPGMSASSPEATESLHDSNRRVGQEQTSCAAGQGSDFIKHVRA